MHIRLIRIVISGHVHVNSIGHMRPFLHFSSSCVFHLLYTVVTVVGAYEKPSGPKGTG